MNEIKSMEYAGNYQALRKQRCDKYKGIFLPLEVLRNIKTDELHLSVSFSGTGYQDTYIYQNVSLYRAAKIKFKWFILPSTVSKILTKREFIEKFHNFLKTEIVDGEYFWVCKEEDEKSFKSIIKGLSLDNSFKNDYLHAYLPDDEK